MNSRLMSILLLTAALASGCIYHSNGYNNGYDNTYPGNVTFTWSFNGQGCSTTAVSYVVIQIPGEALQNNGQYNCTDPNGYPGITINDFAAGTYSYTISAYDASNTLLFTASSSFSVNGDVAVSANLQPVGGANSYAYLTWHFQSAANAPQCGTDFTQVQVTFDGDSSTTTIYGCADGLTAQGVTTNYVASGHHSIELDAVSDSGFLFAQALGTIDTVTGSPISQDATLGWVVGGTAVAWTFNDGVHAPTPDCTQVGVNTLTVNFQDTASGNLVYGLGGDQFACSTSSGPVTSSVYNALPPGHYVVQLLGTGPGPVNYVESTTYTATVQAGVFSSVAQAQTIALVKQ